MEGQILFGLSDDRFLEMKDDGSAEYVTSDQALPEDTRIFVVAEHLDGMRLSIVDGNKSEVPYALQGSRKKKTANMMVTILIAMVRQYDSESADQMERFWFGKKAKKKEESTYNAIEQDSEEDNSPPWYD